MRTHLIRLATCLYRWFLVTYAQLRLRRSNTQYILIGNETILHRYLHNLTRTARESGIQIGIRINPNLLNSFTKILNPYVFKTLKQTPIFFSRKKQAHYVQLDTDYFKTGSDLYRIPIGTHPLFSRVPSPNQTDRTNTIGFIGNDHDSYTEFPSDFWHMPNRIETIASLKATYPESVRARTENFEEYLEYLHNTRYFICLPGVVMPLCHNLYECLECGCIPIVHAAYTQWLHPELKQLLRETTYGSDAELLGLLKSIHARTTNINEKKKKDDLQLHVQQQCAWTSVCRAVHEGKEILICAEEHSVMKARNKVLFDD